MDYRDQLDRIVNIPNTPSRIVSLVPSQTELLVDLGLKDSIVGITKFCIHPAELRKSVTIVGGTKNIHLQKIIDLKPDFIFCNKEENSLEIVEMLQPIAPVWVSDIYSIEDCIQMILMIGEIFHSATAKIIGEDISLRRNNFKEYMQNKKVKSVLYIIWKKPYMAAGRNTFINELLQINKFENVIKDDESRYPEIDFVNFPEIETILLSTEPYPFKHKDAVALGKKLNKKVILVDGEYFSWYGSRLIKAFKYFETLHINNH